MKPACRKDHIANIVIVTSLQLSFSESWKESFGLRSEGAWGVGVGKNPPTPQVILRLN